MAIETIDVDLRFWRSGEAGYARSIVQRRIRIVGSLNARDIDRMRAVARRYPVHVVLERAVDIIDTLEIDAT